MGYSITDEYKHRSFCVNCKEVSSDQHDFGEPGSYHDCVCGKKFNLTTDVCVATIYTSAHGWAYDTSDSQTMATSKSFVLPMPAEVDGLRFEGYMEIDTEPTTIEMRDGETGLLPAGTLVQAQGGIKKYYARYRYVYTEEWAVSDDMKSATLTISNSIINHKETLNATCELLSDTPPTATENGERVYIISVTYQKTSYLTYNFSETLKKKYFYLPAIELDAQADNNEELLGQYDDSEGISSVTIRNLTLRKDGKLHPLCLPFDAVIEGTPLEGATIYELTGTELVGNQLQMNFKPITDDYILGGYPYFVKWASGTDIQNPTFNGVYVNDNPMTVSDTYYLIGGSFDPFAIADEDKGLVYVLSDGKLELAKDDLVAAFSNYLYIPRVSNEDGDLAVCSVRLSFEGDITVEKRVAFTWEGEGTAEKPYLIKNAGQLKDMSAYFNTSDPDVIGKYYRQVANIAFDKTVQNNFTPISSFNGHYDGGGYAISGLNIKRTGSDNAALMLAMAEGSTLKNVIIQNSSFQGSTAAPLAYQLMNAVSIENCHVLKDVTVTSDYHAAAGLVGNIGGLASVKSCTSQAMVTANQSLASGVVGMLTHGSLTDCIYLGSSLSAHASYKTYAVCNNNGGTVKDCYFTAPTLSDALAKLMPQYNKDVDNTGFLTALAARDKFLMETSGLTREQIGYDLTMNSCTTLSAVQNADGTWQSKAYSVCLPFYVSFKEQLGTDELSVLGSVEAYKAHQIDLTKKELIFTNVFPELAAGGAYIVVVKKGSVSLTGKNVTVVDSPAVPDKVMNAADDNQQIGEWKGTFKTIGNDEMIAQNVYIAQRNRTFRCQLKGKTGSWTNPFVGYFSPLEAQASDRFTVKFVYTEQGDDDEGEVTDFPSDEFDYDYDFGSETGIDAVETSNINRQTSDIYDLQGRQLTGQPQKGLYIQNGKKIVIK
ncbi:MAG: hypothetical protein II404_04330 [Prevotella sp.]|nr:hypothetical protein [Prevotella sp.]